MIKFDHVSFGYPGSGGTVTDLSFELEKGTVTAIIGANGAGKSTVSKLMRGLLKPTSGRIFFDGNDIGEMQVSHLAGQIGFLFQNPDRQICKSSVYEELMFSLQFTIEETNRHKALCDEILEALRLNPEDDPMLLSRGERQRVAMATAMVHRPKLLILDEPTTGLDYRECVSIMEYITQLKRSGTTVAMVCHDMEVVLDYAQQSLVMNGGHLIACGETKEIFHNRDILEKASLLPPQMVDLGMRLGKGFDQITTVENMTAAIKARKGGSA